MDNNIHSTDFNQIALQKNTTNSSSTTNQTQIQRNKRKLTHEQCEQINEKLLEIRQLEYEERLVHERIQSIHLKQQYLHSILNLLQHMDNQPRLHTPGTRHSRSKKFDSSP